MRFQKIAAFALTLALSLSLMVAPSAAADEYKPDPESAESYNFNLMMYMREQYGIEIRDVASRLQLPHVGYCKPEKFQEALNAYNTSIVSAIGQSIISGSLADTVLKSLVNGAKARPVLDTANNIYRLRDVLTDSWIVDSLGYYPYCPKDEYEAFLGDGNIPAVEGVYTGPKTANKFVGVRSVDQNSPVIVSYDVLSAACVSLNDQGKACSVIKMPINGVKFYVIYQLNSSDGSYYCNSASRPFVANVEPTVTDNKFDYIVNDNSSTDNSDNSITINDSQIIDLTNGVLNMITENGDRISYNIDNVTYDFDNRSYTVNAYDYNIVNNYYEFNYYTYNVSYTYNNTYITYIGSTAEYQPTEYELYYELPDGRSSADLTAEDIAGLSFEFYDCLNYKKSATDISLRALYHFDGDTDDSSFFSTQTSFTWNKGASITYMDSKAFNGALYLDEKEHEFVITLPSSIGSSDFTLQWRYYQNSATTTEHNENYVMIGNTKLLGWSEQSLYSLASTRLATGLSVGSWQELALVRQSSNLYIYHNGLRVGSASASAVLNNEVTFYFGASSRAYSMIDEMRLVNFPIAKGGASYTPTAVPYDTNSVLILPDGTVPVADEYWKWDKTISPVFSLDMTTGYLSVPPYNSTVSGDYYWTSEPLPGSFYCTMDTGVTVYDGFSRIYLGRSPGRTNMQYSSSALVLPAYNPVLCIGKSVLSPSTQYTATFVTRDLTRYSFTFTTPRSGYTGASVAGVFDWGYVDCVTTWGDYSFLRLRAKSSAAVVLDVIYTEVVPGTQANTGHEFVTCLYPADEVKPNTAAVQSDIPINGYIVGGVRPTFPARGDVWFPVNGSRISGCYIYNGRAWEETNARWYTGKRWIPIYAFDIITLEDMWDIADAPDVAPSINSEQGFWNWWQKEWLDFRAWLAGVFSGSSGGGSEGGDTSGGGIWNDVTGGVVDGISALVSGIIKVITDILSALLSLVTDLLTSIFSFLTDKVPGSIGSFFASFKDGSLFDFFQPDSEGEGAALPEGVASVFAFFSGVIMLLPPELQTLLIFGIAALILISVFKMVKS